MGYYFQNVLSHLGYHIIIYNIILYIIFLLRRKITCGTDMENLAQLENYLLSGIDSFTCSLTFRFIWVLYCWSVFGYSKVGFPRFYLMDDFFVKCIWTFFEMAISETSKKYMPFPFINQYSNTRAVLDCTEICLPRSPTTQSHTYSIYNSINTANYLLTNSSVGNFTFVLKPYGGNVSDNFITEDSGFFLILWKRVMTWWPTEVLQ